MSQGGSPHFVYICSYRTYEEWKQDGENGEVGKGNVLTVPMRNGNFRNESSFIVNVTVLTVPMRNGNLVAVVKLKLLIAGSYRTYEEWKPLTTVVIGLSTASSYRTYEEWKHQWAEGERLTKISSYRTYEEWKQELGINADEYEFLVLTVPMRNGNLARSSQVPLPVPFLPYL